LPPRFYSRLPPRLYSRASPHTFSRALSHFSHGPIHGSYGFGSRENCFEPRRFGYGSRPRRGDRFPHRFGFPTGGSYTHFEPRHLEGSRFPCRGSYPTRPSGEVQKTVKTSSGCMVKCWIPKIYVTNPSTEPLTFFSSCVGDGRRLGGHMAHGFWVFMTHDWKQEMVLQPHSPVTQGVCDFWG
jgi:hypothetical protein